VAGKCLLIDIKRATVEMGGVGLGGGTFGENVKHIVYVLFISRTFFFCFFSLELVVRARDNAI